MGGLNSGRRDGGPTTADAIELDLSRMLRHGLLRPRPSVIFSLFWSGGVPSRKIAALEGKTEIGATDGLLHLRLLLPMSGDRRPNEQQVSLITTPQPFGGRRWWFVCPITGCRTSKLYLPVGAFRFASRLAHGLPYPSQRQSPFQRARERALRLRAELGASPIIGEVVEKPSRMRYRTFCEKHRRLIEAEAIVEARCATIFASTLQDLDAYERKMRVSI